MGSVLDLFKSAVKLCPEDLDFIQCLLRLLKSGSCLRRELSEAFMWTVGICAERTPPLRRNGRSE